ncbi:laminin subunit gamma-3 [Limosa lapponica baueri]|uniref:Laminin subunit gamma-3 n=1 Tax=Limosa lapponica baueri TaxID=1758121 RepID=A0A2I0SZZ4_LIMLA|nr:laminin subunit gamma-3 [Limosa lapponica baueri]
MPVFENAAFGRAAEATNTCGSPPEDYCLQMGARHASALCHRCDATDPRLHHNASFLTDFHSQEESTWWQSQSMAFGIQYPNSVNITLHLDRTLPKAFRGARSGMPSAKGRSVKRPGEGLPHPSTEPQSLGG